MRISVGSIGVRELITYLVLGCFAIIFPFVLIKGPAFTGPILFLLILAIPVLLLIFRDYRNGVYILFIYGGFMFLIDRYLQVDLPFGVIFDLLIIISFFIMVIAAKGKTPFQWKFNNIVTIALILFYGFFTLEIANPNAMGIAGWLGASRFYIYLLLFYIFIHFFQDIPNIKRFIYLWLGIAMLAALYGIFQEVFGLRNFEMAWVSATPERYKLYFIWGKMRKFSFLSDPSAFGLFMAFSGTTSLILGFGPFANRKRLLLFIGAVLMIVSMSFAGTRTAYVMVGVGVIFFILLNIRNRKIIIASMVLMMGFLAIMYGPFYSAPVMRMRSTFNASDDASMGVRDYKRIKFQPYIQRNPIGGGLNTAGNNGLKYSRGHQLAGRFDPDSGYLRTGMEMGSIGLLLSLFLNCSVMVLGVINHYRIKDPLLKIVNVAFVAPFVGLSVAHFAQDALLNKPMNLLTYGTYALMIIISDIDKNKQINEDEIES